MNITHLELATKNLQAQKEFYSNILGLPRDLSLGKLEVQAGTTKLIFTQADFNFDGAYHFAFNVPENKIRAAKEWISAKTELLYDENRLDEFDFSNWNAHSIYFKDAAGNILEFIARHDLKNAVEGRFDGSQILNVSEIGLPSEDVIAFANEICTKMNLSVFRGEPGETLTPVGDDNGLFILPIKGRIWYPNTGVTAKLLPIRVKVEANGREWEIRGVPYQIISPTPSTL